MKQDISYRYGLLKQIITNNARNLKNKMMQVVYSLIKIQHRNSISYRSKMNKVIKVANMNIKKIVGNMDEIYKDWHKKLPFALHAYHRW